MKSGISLDETVVTGTRFGGRTSTETTVPVDIINIKTIKAVASQTEINQILNYSATG